MKIDILKKILKVIAIVVLLVIGYHYGGEIQDKVSIEEIQSFIESFGIFGVFLFILFTSVRPIFFLPNSIIFIMGGVLYGTLLGSLISLVGFLISASLCYLLANRFQVFFSKLVGEKYIKKLERVKERESIKALFMMRVTPGFPIDPVSYGAGLTNMNYYDFFIGTLLGISPKIFLYTFLGDGIDDIFSIRTIAVLVILTLLAIFPIISKQFKWSKIH